jgi:hypothetical protein
MSFDSLVGDKGGEKGTQINSSFGFVVMAAAGYFRQRPAGKITANALWQLAPKPRNTRLGKFFVGPLLARPRQR